MLEQQISESSRKRKTANEAAGKKKAAGRRRKELTIEEMEERRKKKNEKDRLYRAARKADYNRLKLKESTTAAVTHNNNKLDAGIRWNQTKLQETPPNIIAISQTFRSGRLTPAQAIMIAKFREANKKLASMRFECTQVNLETSQLSHSTWESNFTNISSGMHVVELEQFSTEEIQDMLKTPSPQRSEFPMNNPVYQLPPPPTQQLGILEVEEAPIPIAPCNYSAVPLVEGNDNVLHSSFFAPDNNMQVNDIIAGTSHSQSNCRSLADQILSMLSEVDDERDLSAADFGYDLGALDMMTYFAEYRIPILLLSTATSLFPTISQSHRVTKSRKSLRTCAFILLCAAVLNIESTSFSNMSVDAFRKWRDAIDEADSVGFNVEILRSGLMRVAKAYLGHMKGSLYMNEQNMAEMSNSLTHAEEVSRQTEVELHLVMQRAEDSRTNIAFIKGEISRLSSEQDRLMSLDICNEGASEECMRLRTMFDATPGHFTNWN